MTPHRVLDRQALEELLQGLPLQVGGLFRNVLVKSFLVAWAVICPHEELRVEEYFSVSVLVLKMAVALCRRLRQTGPAGRRALKQCFFQSHFFM